MIDNLIRLGATNLFHADEFLPSELRDAFFAFATSHRERFLEAPQMLNDPEYRRTRHCADLGPFAQLFQNTLGAAWREIMLCLALPVTQPARWQMSLSQLLPGAYRKPRAEVWHGEANATASFIYALGAQPRPYTGGFLRFFDHNPYINPYDRGAPKFCRQIEFPATPNSLIVFPSSTFCGMTELHHLSETAGNEMLLLEGCALPLT